MTTAPPSVVAGWTAALWFGGVTAIFAMATIVYLILKGEATNTLQNTAMTWAWFSLIGVAAGFGVGSIIGPITDIWKK